MHCRNCGQDVHPQAVACPACGVPPLLESKYCQACGAATQVAQVGCTRCGVGLLSHATSEKKLAAGLLALLLNGLGVHKFYLGYTAEGMIMLALTLAAGIATCGLSSVVMTVIGIVEGVLYLTKSDQEFERIYVRGRRPWF